MNLNRDVCNFPVSADSGTNTGSGSEIVYAEPVARIICAYPAVDPVACEIAVADAEFDDVAGSVDVTDDRKQVADWKENTTLA